MGITPSLLCCHEHASNHQKKLQSPSVGNGSGGSGGSSCPEASPSPCCPATPLEPIKPEPLLSRVHLLSGCTSVEKHNRKIKNALHKTENLHGEEGLKAVGLQYRRFYCIEHQSLADNTPPGGSEQMDDSSLMGDRETEDVPSSSSLREQQPLKDRTTTVETTPSSTDNSFQQPSYMIATPASPASSNADAASDVSSSRSHDVDDFPDGNNDDVDKSGNEHEDLVYEIPLRSATPDDNNDAEICSTSSVIGTGDHLTVAESLWDDFASVDFKYCINCRRKLLHTASGTVLDGENRADFIADGIMYDRVSKLCMEAAQDIMCQEYDLEWTDVAPSAHHGERAPIRALVSKENLDENGKSTTTGTLIICTGRGVVGAGIFSRQAMVYGEGLEVGCAWHLLREASFRKLRVVMPDPNCRGDRWGYDVMRQTLRKLWPTDINEDIYMVIHSASGAHVQRFLLDTPNSTQTHMPQIKAVCLTDSTHNLQWSKKEPEWRDFWESDRCIYFKSAQTMRDAVGSRWYLHAAGAPIHTDSFWKHRFGNVQTCWAGTDVHSMTNWFSHQPMWKHLDLFWKQRQQNRQKEIGTL